MALHKLIGTGDIHIAHQWEYANAAAREGATGFEAADVHKLALQLDTHAFWVLTNHDPVTWQALGAGAVAFLNLTDTPASYSDQAGKVVAVKQTEDGLEFVTIADVDSADVLHFQARKASAGTIAKGEAVYLVGFSGGYAVVEKAQANAAGTMPAVGLAATTITDSQTGDVVLSGCLCEMDTSSWTAGTQLYVSPGTAGGLTSTKPTGTSLVQKLGQVIRQDATDGALLVLGAGRTNDLPNLAEGKYWRGNASGVPTETDAPVYGSERSFASADAESSTTSQTYVQRLQLSTGTVPAGTYRLSWSSEVAATAKSKSFSVRVQLDDTTDIAGLTTVSADDLGWQCFSGFTEVALGAGSHTLDLDYRMDVSGEVRIKQARLSCIRVA